MKIEYSAEADKDFEFLSSVDPMLASYVLDQIDVLAENPMGLSLPPHAFQRQSRNYAFWGPGDDRKHRITVYFDLTEERLRVLAIGYVKYA